MEVDTGSHGCWGAGHRWCRTSPGPTLTPAENLVVEGISPINAALVEEVRPYTESRGASFVDWHPTDERF